MRAPELWADDNLPARLLSPLGQVFGLAGRLRRRMAHPVRVDLPVICVGDLVAGGAGKTPVAIALALHLGAHRGQRPHLLTRGYGGWPPGPLRVDPARHGAATVGDEALLGAEAAPTWCARDRVARRARGSRRLGADLLIMDDGFPEPVAASGPGPPPVVDGTGVRLRQSTTAASGSAARADRGWPRPRASSGGPAGPGRGRPRSPVAARGQPGARRALPRPAGAAPLAGRRVVAFAGIGRPEKFFRSLAEAGAVLVARHAFADHHRYRRRETLALLAEAAAKDAICVTAAKDRVRLPAELRALITILPTTVIWRDPNALDRFPSL